MRGWRSVERRSLFLWFVLRIIGIISKICEVKLRCYCYEIFSRFRSLVIIADRFYSASIRKVESYCNWRFLSSKRALGCPSGWMKLMYIPMHEYHVDGETDLCSRAIISTITKGDPTQKLSISAWLTTIW